MRCTYLDSGCGHPALNHEGFPTAVFHLLGWFLPPVLLLESDGLRCVQSHKNINLFTWAPFGLRM